MHAIRDPIICINIILKMREIPKVNGEKRVLVLPFITSITIKAKYEH